MKQYPYYPKQFLRHGLMKLLLKPFSKTSITINNFMLKTKVISYYCINTVLETLLRFRDCIIFYSQAEFI